MLAFLDSPIQLIVAGVVILILFGPQKLPEMLGQLGKAIREFKRYSSDMTDMLHSSMNDTRYDSTNPPTHYDSYGNIMAESKDPPSDYTAPIQAASLLHGASTVEQPIGDFMAPAMVEEESSQTSGAPKVNTPPPTPRSADGIVPRSS